MTGSNCETNQVKPEAGSCSTKSDAEKKMSGEKGSCGSSEKAQGESCSTKS
ncbi:MAG: hypothetical protein M3N08_06450 [Pseudomonadota bacterium]|nr:hypothetical protein [Pseudomonadota bacterium]